MIQRRFSGRLRASKKKSHNNGSLADVWRSGRFWEGRVVIMTKSESLKQKHRAMLDVFGLTFGAGNEVRTRDLNLGKVALYQLSYSRKNGVP